MSDVEVGLAAGFGASLWGEAVHTERRVVHVRGDMAGAAIMAALVEAVKRTPSIRLFEGFIGESLTTRGKRVTGIIARRREGGDAVRFPTRALILASGGVGHLYGVTTNPPEAEGDGLGMTAQAGAVIADAEFVQFHPTALDVGRDPAPLATEALRGEGATLIDDTGLRFMVDVDPRAELAPRDIVARAVHNRIAAGHGVFLDCRDEPGAAITEKFPTVAGYCREAGIDPERQPIPIAPAAHYHMGGILTDANGRASLDGLWACGEVTSTGAHGANRLASNSLLEAVAFAARVASDIHEHLPQPMKMVPTSLAADGIPPEPDADDYALLRRTMTRHVGVVRDAAGLTETLRVIAELEAKSPPPRFRNVLVAAKMITAAALRRTESRGGHYRSDFPKADPAWQHRGFMTLADAERMTAELSPAEVEGAVAG
jgi:L-aspartate oxidase